MIVDEFLARLDHVREAGPNKWTARCPGHDDHENSLSVKVTDDKILVKCFGPCATKHVCAVMGISLRDLFLSNNGGPANGHGRRPRPAPARLTLADFAAAKGLPEDFLSAQGVEEMPGGWLQLTYRLRDGSPAPRHRKRTALIAKEGSLWTPATGPAPVPYGLWRLDDASDKGDLLLVEGETDPLTAWYHNIAALGLPGASTAKLLTADMLQGVGLLWVLEEPDDGGKAFVRGVGTRLRELEWRGEARILRLPVKDVNDLHRTAGDGFAVAMATAQAAAGPIDLGISTIEVSPVRETSPEPYRFITALPRDHFVSQFIAYGAECVDAAHEHIETTGLTMLGVATPGVRARLRQYPRGLSTASYSILLGDSTRSRKTSVASLGLDLLADAVPDARLSEHASPEAVVEQLAERDGDSTLWYADEIGETLDRLHHQKYMAGLRGLLLELYEGRPYRYKRTTKRTKGGVAIVDEMTIERPHLCVLGATTPAIFEIITARDIASGFMARFAVTMPTRLPPRRGLEEPTDDLMARRGALVKHLHAIYVWAKTAHRPVRFVGDALRIVDDFAVAIETSDALANGRARAMLQRLNAMTVKLSMLAAAGRPQALEADDLRVTPEDAAAAVAIATHWRDYAIAFGERVGETALEGLIVRALEVVRTKGRCPRRVVAQLVHCPKRTMDDIEATLVDRGQIAIETVEPQSGPAARIWRAL
jgi:hypothetical protein